MSCILTSWLPACLKDSCPSCQRPFLTSSLLCLPSFPFRATKSSYFLSAPTVLLCQLLGILAHGVVQAWIQRVFPLISFTQRALGSNKVSTSFLELASPTVLTKNYNGNFHLLTEPPALPGSLLSVDWPVGALSWKFPTWSTERGRFFFSLGAEWSSGAARARFPFTGGGNQAAVDENQSSLQENRN